MEGDLVEGEEAVLMAVEMANEMVAMKWEV